MSCLLIKAGDWAQQPSRSLLDLVFYVIQHQKKILFSLPSTQFLPRLLAFLYPYPEFCPCCYSDLSA